jgi:DNA-directed RNA polymerase specialized sigma24 family protein
MRGKRGADLTESDIGLAISGARLERAPELTLRYGVGRTEAELAAFMGVSRSGVGMIEHRALRKLRRAILMRKDPLLTELVEQVIGRKP